MRSMSSLDIAIIIKELKDVIGSRVDKIYHYPPDEIRIKLRGKGRWDLVIEAGKRFHPTIFPKESPRNPSSFAMLLRKHLEGAKLVSIQQYDFDRVILLDYPFFFALKQFFLSHSSFFSSLPLKRLT